MFRAVPCFTGAYSPIQTGASELCSPGFYLNRCHNDDNRHYSAVNCAVSVTGAASSRYFRLHHWTSDDRELDTEVTDEELFGNEFEEAEEPLENGLEESSESYNPWLGSTNIPEDGTTGDTRFTDGPEETRSRFGAPKFMESTSRIMEAAGSRLKKIFSWRNDDEGDDKIDEASAPVEMAFGKQQLHSARVYEEDELLRMPYYMSREVNMGLDRWPENCFLRIRLVSYYPYLLRFAADRLIRGIREQTNLRVGNVKPMPMRKKRWCLLSSPHVDKRSKDLFEIQEHVRFLDVFPAAKKPSTGESGAAGSNAGCDATTPGFGNVDAAAGSTEQYPNYRAEPWRNSRWMGGDHSGESSENLMKFKGLLMVPMPSMVSFDYWFEEVHKPVKNREIEKQFSKRIWVSKYFLYNREKREKAEIIDKLTSPELYAEIPLRWKKHPCDYFALQLGELRKLYRFVVARKAEDDARRRYGVKMPQLPDVDEVRFVPNEEDRRCGYISSDDDDEDITKAFAALDDK